MNSVRLKMNNSKSELIIFGNNIQTSKCITREINIKGETVHRSQSIRYLGVGLDSDLTFRTHVKKKCTTTMLNLQRMKNIHKYLTTECCIKLVVSLCLSTWITQTQYYVAYLISQSIRYKGYKIMVPN